MDIISKLVGKNPLNLSNFRFRTISRQFNPGLNKNAYLFGDSCDAAVNKIFLPVTACSIEILTY
jgi:hypothetical protein